MKYKTPLIAHSHDEFIDLLDKAFDKKTDAEYISALDEEAMANSWDKKTDEILRMLNEAESE